MAYNPNYFFPNGYQPMQMQPIPQQMNPQQAMIQNPPQSGGSGGILWVQGEEGAKAFPVGAGNTVLMMDVESPTVYMKTVESNGRPQPLKVYDLVERTAQNQSVSPSDSKERNVSREEFEELRSEVRKLSKGIRKTDVKKDEEDENV